MSAAPSSGSIVALKDFYFLPFHMTRGWGTAKTTALIM